MRPSVRKTQEVGKRLGYLHLALGIGEMAIPDLDGEGFLPEGVHECSLDEIEQRFGGNHSGVRRWGLFAKLRDYLDELRSTGMAAGLIVDGSFITKKTEPNDNDLVLILPERHVGPRLGLVRRLEGPRRVGCWGDAIMKVEQGQIVFLNFPFSDGSGAKVRPAVVLQSNRENQ